ncbi:MAG: PAS domain S-box protein [Bacteroidales bacterium]|jgi:PAS domain S-box-containing protein|nr:PAS domain S-box protein [Bacteroidales bacterium]MDY0197291.1 PAS domain S-box protein [Tenuifilaceae bacterium]
MELNSSFESARYKIMDTMLLIGMIVSIPAAIASGYRIFTMGVRILFIVDILFAVILILAYLTRSRTNYKWRTFFLLLYVFFLSLISLYTWGLWGLGLFMMFFTIIIATTLFGIRYGFLSLGFSLLAIIIAIICIHYQWVVFSWDFNSLSHSTSHWLLRGVFYTSLTSIALVTLGLVHKNFERVNRELSVSEERQKLALSAVSEVVWDINLLNKNNFISHQYAEVLPFAPKNLAKGVREWKKIIYDVDLPKVNQNIEDHLNGLTPDINIEYRIKNTKGAINWLQTKGKVVERDKDGKAIRLVGTHSNIGPRKEMEQILKESEQKYRSLFVNANDAILLVSKRIIIDANDCAIEFLGENKDSLIGKDIVEFCPFEQIDGTNSEEKFTQLIDEAIANGSAKTECELLSTAKDKLFYTSVSVNSYDDTEKKIQQVIIHDITEHKQFEQEKLKAIVDTEEKERLKLAGNLHDDVGPLLSSINMYLSLLKRDETENKDGIFQNIESILKDAIASVREVSNNISPHALNNYGLVYTTSTFIERSKNLVEFHFDENIGDIRLPLFIEMICYRIIKELINNTLKYANAKSVWISMQRDDNWFQMKYRDDGIGFSLESKMNSGETGIGLLNISNRLKTLGATYSMYSELGNGFSFETKISV